VAIAIALELWIYLPCLGAGRYVQYDARDVANGIFWHVFVVGGGMFRAGMLYANGLRAAAPAVPPADPDTPPAAPA
jgi:hypothetical protein